MQAWVPILLGNTLLAGLLAVSALIVMRLHRPALAHALWLLVLIKLITPTIWNVPIPWPQSRVDVTDTITQPEPLSRVVSDPSRERSLPSPGTPGEGLREGSVAPLVAEPSPTPLPAYRARVTKLKLPSLPTLLVVTWLTGSFLWLMLLAIRVRRFNRLSRGATTVSPEVQQRADMLAKCLGLSGSPQVELISASISPMLWLGSNSARLLVPTQLLHTLDPEQRDALLLHELAHLKRKDHLTRLLEIVVTMIFWWHPLVWIARRGLREAEEQCCDAWVIWAMPGIARRYADALLDTLDFLAASPLSLPPGASGLGGLHHLETRLTMIFTNTPPRAMSWIGRIIVLMLLGLLPLGMVWSQNQLSAPAIVPAQTRGRLVGSDGKPPAGAQAWIITGSAPDPLVYSPVKVDTDGRFSASGSSAGTLIARAPNHGMVVRRLDADLDGATINVRLPKPTRLRLTVMDMQGEPVANVRVGLGSLAMRSINGPAMPADLRQHLVQTSDNQGICTFYDVGQEALFPFEVFDQRFAQPDLSQAVATGQQESCEGELRLTPAARITGTIAFADSNKPVGGVRVTGTPVPGAANAGARPPTIYATASADGRFELNQLLGIMYTLSAELPEALRSDYAVRGKFVTDVVAGQEVQGQTLSVVRSGTVRGRVTSNSDGQALAGVSIRALEKTTVPVPGSPLSAALNMEIASTKTASDGTFQLQLPEGEFDLLASSQILLNSGFKSPISPVTISEGMAAEANFVFSRAPLPEGSITVRGHVRDPRGNPISGVIVAATPLSVEGGNPKRGRSNDDGSFVIEGVNPDSELGLVSNLWTTLQGVKVGDKEGPFDLVAHEDQFATARIVVLDEDGKPIPGASTRLVTRIGTYRQGPDWISPTGPDGSWTYRWNHPSHEVEAYARGTGYGTVMTLTTLEPGKQTDIVLRLTKVEGAFYTATGGRRVRGGIGGRGRGGIIVAPVPAPEVLPPPSAQEQQAIEERLRARRLQEVPNGAP